MKKKKQVIVRDDDCSFFTKPYMLETLYDSLWERNCPVSLSTILKALCPTEKLNTVVPSYETFSKELRENILSSDMNMSTMYEVFFDKTFWDSIKERIFKDNSRSIGPYLRNAIQIGNSKFFFGYHIFFQHKDPDTCLQKGIELFEASMKRDGIFIIANHYWYFFENWEHVKKDLLDAWKRFVEFLLAQKDVEFTTFEKIKI